MKITKFEKIWLVVVLVLFLLYNFPGFPAYGDVKGCLLSGLLLVGGIWIAIYVGMKKLYQIQKLKEEEDEC